MTRAPFLAAAALSLALGACAHSYESRIRSNLMDAGLSRSVAGCVAERMVDRLSRDQLHSIARLGKSTDRNLRDMTLGQFLRHYRAALDPEVYGVMTRAGVGCAIAG
ncbi:MAG: hypothetical protein ACK40O_02690 [Allosphingosinicella sp.]